MASFKIEGGHKLKEQLLHKEQKMKYYKYFVQFC